MLSICPGMSFDLNGSSLSTQSMEGMTSRQYDQLFPTYQHSDNTLHNVTLPNNEIMPCESDMPLWKYEKQDQFLFSNAFPTRNYDRNDMSFPSYPLSTNSMMNTNYESSNYLSLNNNASDMYGRITPSSPIKFTSFTSPYTPLHQGFSRKLSCHSPSKKDSLMRVSRSDPSFHKRYVCCLCGKRFTRPSSLTTHIYSHTGEKPFKCEVDGCGRHFSVVSNLKRHAKVHMNTKDHRYQPIA